MKSYVRIYTWSQCFQCSESVKSPTLNPAPRAQSWDGARMMSMSYCVINIYLGDSSSLFSLGRKSVSQNQASVLFLVGFLFESVEKWNVKAEFSFEQVVKLLSPHPVFILFYFIFSFTPFFTFAFLFLFLFPFISHFLFSFYFLVRLSLWCVRQSVFPAFSLFFPPFPFFLLFYSVLLCPIIYSLFCTWFSVSLSLLFFVCQSSPVLSELSDPRSSEAWRFNLSRGLKWKLPVA